MLNRLTQKAVEAAKPDDKKALKFADGGGLFLFVKPKPSGARGWRFRYRWLGKEKLLSLGPYPTVGLAKARKRRDEARQLLDDGIDPSADRKAKRAALVNTFEGIAKEWLALQRFAETTRTRNERILGHLYKEIGATPVSIVTAPELLGALRVLEKRGSETAHRACQLATNVFRYAIVTRRLAHNPAAGLTKALAPVAERHLPAITDPKKLGPLLFSIDHYNGQPATRAALQLLALTFVRPGELRMATWSEFDLGTEQWVVPASRTKMRKEHIVPLASQSLTILKGLEKTRDSSRLVFPSLRAGRPLSENTLNLALRNMGYSGDVHVAHGFRSTASTLLHERGLNHEVIEAQLAHARPGVSGVYNRSHLLRQRRKLMQQWADYLDGLKSNQPAGASSTSSG